MIAECLERDELFNDREYDFLCNARDLFAAGHELTEKQPKWIRQLHKMAVTKWARAG